MSRQDTRYCYGANCTWCGPIQDVGTFGGGHHLPCCPHCKGMLFELPNAGYWWDDIDLYEKGRSPRPSATGELEGVTPRPGYRAMWEWQVQQKTCFRDMAALVAAYKAATGNEVQIP
jgi:hypothetical protein